MLPIIFLRCHNYPLIFFLPMDYYVNLIINVNVNVHDNIHIYHNRLKLVTLRFSESLKLNFISPHLSRHFDL